MDASTALGDIFGTDFDLDDAASSGKAGVEERIAEGKYNVEIVRAERKPTKDGTGTGLNFAFKIKGGRFDGRWVWRYFYVQGPPDKASGAANGRADFARMIKACGLSRVPGDLLALEARTLAVDIKHLDDSYGEKDKPVAFHPHDKALAQKHLASDMAKNSGQSVASLPTDFNDDDDVPF